MFSTEWLHILIHDGSTHGHWPTLKGSSVIQVEDYIEAVCSVALSTYVDAPVENLGGLQIVGPPGALKSTIVKIIDSMDKGLCLSAINMTTFRALVNDIAAGKLKALAFEEWATIYAGDPRTASRVETTIAAMVEQGHSTMGLQDERMQRLIARCVVIGAMTPEFHEKHFNRWEDSGFHRRFLWSLVKLSDPDKLVEAVIEWQRIDIPNSRVPNIPLSLRIKDTLSPKERRELQRYLRKQPGSDMTSQLRLLCKMTSALAWWYSRTGNKKDAMKTIRAFCASLGKTGDELII